MASTMHRYPRSTDFLLNLSVLSAKLYVISCLPSVSDRVKKYAFHRSSRFFLFKKSTNYFKEHKLSNIIINAISWLMHIFVIISWQFVRWRLCNNEKNSMRNVNLVVSWIFAFIFCFWWKSLQWSMYIDTGNARYLFYMRYRSGYPWNVLGNCGKMRSQTESNSVEDQSTRCFRKNIVKYKIASSIVIQWEFYFLIFIE